MSSYFDYFCKNLENDTNCNDNEFVKGTCCSMCPQEEVRLREKESLVHVLEVIGPVRKLVKCYSRSAADSKMTVPRLLRPYRVLQDTVQYLLLDVTKRNDVANPVVYDFLTDRLRAVRQDMTIQRLPPHECVLLLEPMIRFHVYYGYILCNYPIKDYDPLLNKKYLLECIKWFLSCCDKIDQSQKGGTVADLSQLMSDINIKEYNNKLACDRVLMESLYILCNLNNVHPMLRYLSLPKEIKSNPRLSLAFKIAMAHLKGNYIQICKSLDSLCPLSYYALSTYLPVLQRHAILVMCHAYNSKRLTVESSVVGQWLRLGGEERAREVCTHYGLAADGSGVRFDKGQFKHDAVLHQVTTQESKDIFNIQHIFTYNTIKDII